MSSTLDLSKELVGRRAIVTGGTTGIGAAIAQRFLDVGAKVVVVARSRRDTTPAGATFISGDLRTVEGAKKIAEQALAVLGGVDILVNNAGGANAFADSSKIPDDDWQDVFALNLFAAVRLTNALLPALRESKSAAIVNISSIAATMAFAPSVHYSAAKAALNAYSRSLAVELAPSKVRVNVVSPGLISTPSSNEWRKNSGMPADAWPKMVPLGRIGETDDVTEVVALLVSGRGQWLTGGDYRVDGGMAAK